MIQCDLVLLTWNYIEYTKKCVESLYRNTDIPCRLIVVDNGSDQPGALEYLGEIKPLNNIKEVVLLQNGANLGYPKGVNTGIRYALAHSTAPYVCVLNNDVIVGQRWLSEMVHVLEMDRQNGIVNPESTTFNTYPDSEEQIDSFAKGIWNRHKGEWMELGSCIGFCMLFKRRILEEVGILDEKFGMAYYEDSDLSKRVQQRGYQCVLAKGAYVYHYGDRSLKDVPKRDELFLKNEEIFYSRWKMKKPLRISYILSGKRLRGQRVLYEKMRESANQFNKIWILYRNGVEEQKIPNHWNIQRVFFRGPSFFFDFWSLAYLLVKKKKFNTVFVDDLRLLAFLRRFQGRYQGELRLLSMNNEQQIMNRPSYVICAVERGWKGMRQFALAMAEKGYHVDLILREKLPSEVRKIISSREGIQIIPCGKKIFQFRFAATVIQRALRGRVTWLILNRPERVRENDWLCRLVTAKPLLLEEKGNLYRLFLHGGEVTLDSLNNAT